MLTHCMQVTSNQPLFCLLPKLQGGRRLPLNIVLIRGLEQPAVVLRQPRTAGRRCKIPTTSRYRVMYSIPMSHPAPCECVMLGDAQLQGCSLQVQLSMLKHWKQRASAQGIRKAQLQSPAAVGVRTGPQLSLLT